MPDDVDSIQPAFIEAFAFRVPIERPVRVSFGTFRDRPLVLVRVVDVEGTEGWGEVWCNWPAVGAEHRARLAADLGARLVGRSFAGPEDASRALAFELEVLVLQTGEIGPIAQVIAGIDIALWDLAARKRNLALHRCLGGAPAESVPVYATGVEPDDPERFAEARLGEDHRAFKLKVGFGQERDVKNLEALRAVLGSDLALMADANQALTLDGALAFARAAAPPRSAMAGGAAAGRRAPGGLVCFGCGVDDPARRRREPPGRSVRRGRCQPRPARSATGRDQMGRRLRQSSRRPCGR